MNTHVRLFGIPKQLTTKKLVKILGNVLNINMKNVYVKSVHPSGSKKDAILTFSFACDAQLAQEKLDNFVYTYNNELYVFSAKYYKEYDTGINNKAAKFLYRHGESREHGASYIENYTESGFQNRNLNKESSDLDRRIEILKKKKKLLEEERKLLEEQQKLHEFKMKIQLPTTGDHLKRALDTAQSFQPDSNVAKKLAYHSTNVYCNNKACEVLIKKMTKFIKQYSRSENREALLMRLRVTLKDRIFFLVHEQPINKVRQIIDQYRSRYPESEDESLVREMVQNLDETIWTEGESLRAELEMTGENAGNTTNSGAKHKVKTGNKEKKPKKVSVTGDNPAPAKQMYYFHASKMLLKIMKKVLDDNAEGEKRKALVALLNYRVKDRFAAVIAGRPIFQTYKVIKAYRDVYPISEDDEFIKGLLKEIDDNKWTIEDIKKMNNKWNKSDTMAKNADVAGENNTVKEGELETSVEEKNEDQSQTVNKGEVGGNLETEDISEGKNNADQSQTVNKGEVEGNLETEEDNSKVENNADQSQTVNNGEVEGNLETEDNSKDENNADQTQTVDKGEVEGNLETEDNSKGENNADQTQTVGKGEVEGNLETEDNSKGENNADQTQTVDKGEVQGNLETEDNSKGENNADQTQTVGKGEVEGNLETEDNSKGENNAVENQIVSKSEADNSENKGNSLDENSFGVNEATKPDSSEKKNEEATNAQPSVNNTREDPNCESTKQNDTEDSMNDENRGIKRKCNADDDENAKLLRIWEEGADDLDVADEHSFEDWS